jgi:hypothetical protein
LPGTLAHWSGTPLDKQNQQSYFETGTLVCLIGDPRRLEAILVIDQMEIGLVEPGQRVRLKFAQLPGVCLDGAIIEISEMDLRVAPRGLAAAGDLPTKLDQLGIARPRNTVFQARVELSPQDTPVLPGATGQAKIAVAPRSVGSRFLHYLSRTFRFDL